MPAVSISGMLLLQFARPLRRLQTFRFVSSNMIKASESANRDGSVTFGPANSGIDPGSGDASIQRFFAQEYPSLESLIFSGVHLPSHFYLPKLMPNLRSLDLSHLSWGRMVFDLFHKAPALERIRFSSFDFIQEPDHVLPVDWTDEMVRHRFSHGGEAR